MRLATYFLFAACLEAQPALPLERVLQQRRTANTFEARDLRNFRQALSSSRPQLERGSSQIVWDDAIGYLGGFEAGATSPDHRLELANTYRDLGDRLGGPYGRNLGQSAAAVRCYQRAMFLLGGAGPFVGQSQAASFGGGFGSRRNPRGFDQSLESLAMRLTLLNAPFLLGGGGLFSDPNPAPPPRPPVSFQPSPPLAGLPVPPRGTSPEGVELVEQFANVSARGQALLSSVDDLRQSLAARGLTIHGDIASSLSRLRLYLELAATSLEQESWANARRQLEKAQYEAGKLARHLGQ
jgi:hypothetical protein